MVNGSSFSLLISDDGVTDLELDILFLAVTHWLSYVNQLLLEDFTIVMFLFRNSCCSSFMVVSLYNSFFSLNSNRSYRLPFALASPRCK